ncbi:hypothetical protein ACLKMY_15915 [Paraburkholderia mimosarum]|uniref:hypothetical protein n=1 Tax=Paraburkholderia mimosarum TaxID=312026 RepID=UPI0039C2B8E5
MISFFMRVIVTHESQRINVQPASAGRATGLCGSRLCAVVNGSFAERTLRSDRIISQVRGDTIFIHLVVDARRDLPALLQRIILRLM